MLWKLHWLESNSNGPSQLCIPTPRFVWVAPEMHLPANSLGTWGTLWCSNCYLEDRIVLIQWVFQCGKTQGSCQQQFTQYIIVQQSRYWILIMLSEHGTHTNKHGRQNPHTYEPSPHTTKANGGQASQTDRCGKKQEGCGGGASSGENSELLEPVPRVRKTPGADTGLSIPEYGTWLQQC